MAREREASQANRWSLATICSFLRRCLFSVISVGPLPKHVAFIMDGNRRYAKKKNLEKTDSYNLGFLTLMSTLKYCYELRIKYVSVYAFSIDNFRREPENVEFLMELMQEKLESLLKEESIASEYGLRVNFVGNLNLLSKKLRDTTKKAMEATAKNENIYLQICVAYTTTDEIVHAVEESCYHRWRDEARNLREIELPEIEKQMYMYMSVQHEPDILIRTSGEKRLSNFLLWQTQSCLLHSPSALWPEFGLWHLVWALLNFQRHYQYLNKKRKQL